jgi:hypothetical protein
MGTTLTGTTPQDTYDSLIKVTDNGPLSGTLKALSDGLGNDSTLSLSTAAASIAGTLAVTGNATFDTDTLVVDATNNRLAMGGATVSGYRLNVYGLQRMIGTDTVLNFGELDASGTYFQSLNTASDTGKDFAFFGTAELMRIKGSGNVGIGTNDPAALLDVQAAGSAVGSIKLSSAVNTNGAAYLAQNAGGTSYFGRNSSTGGAFTGAAYATVVYGGGAYPMSFYTNDTERMRITSAGNVSIGTTAENAKFTVEQPSAARITSLVGNGNDQGFAQNYRVVRHYPVVSLGTKLIIPFAVQGNLNSNTFVRVFGHSARFNSSATLAFTADFEVGHLTSIQASATLSSTGNVASIASNGASAMEITFTSAYTSATADGVFVTIEYMTNNINYSIDVANIAMN